jgi:hypothetical protein
VLFSDLNEIKGYLEIDPGDHSEDKQISFCCEWASKWIEEILARPDLARRERTEYYAGSGTQQLLLRSRPVYATPTILLYLDESGYFGSVAGSFGSTTALVYGDDFALDIRENGQPSRSGILVRFGNFWPKPSVRERGILSPYVAQAFGTIKVVYTAGYTMDTLPADLRFACNMLAARIRYQMPLGMELNSENYEDRSIGILADAKNYLISPEIRRILLTYRNWKW